MLTRRAMLRKMLGAGAAAAAGAVALGAAPSAEAASTYYLTTDWVNFRKGPGTNYPVRKVLAPEEKVRYLGKSQNGFVQVMHNGMGGWVHLDYLVFADGGNPGNVTIIGNMVTTDYVNLRAGASTGHQVLRVLNPWTTVAASDIVSNGFRLVVHQGTEGWVYDTYLGWPDGQGIHTATATSALNLRAEPHLGGQVLLVIPQGGKVSTGDQIVNGFRSVTYNGVSGWAHTDYLSI